MDNILELDDFIDPAVGAGVSFHSITWNAGKRQSRIPAGGNLHYHSLPSGGTAPHSHEFGEIVLVLEGAVRHAVNGEVQLLPVNSVTLLRPSDNHGFRPAPDASRCELLLLSFHLEFFATLSHYLEDDKFLHRYTESVLPPVFQLSEREMNELSLKLLGLNSHAMPQERRKIHFKIILLELFTRFFLPPEGGSSGRGVGASVPPWLETLCERMKRPENLTVGLKRLQQLSGYTTEHLCKMFRRHLDKTPTEFINELRINHAARLLADTALPIIEISCQLNFQSLSRFYFLFRQQYGCTPAMYRGRARAARKLL